KASHCQASLHTASEQVQIFLLLPGSDLRSIGRFLLKAFDLRRLDVCVIVDESAAEPGPERFIGTQRDQGLAEIFWKQGGRRFVGRVGRGPRIQPARNAVEPGINLRSEIEIRICRWLADPVFKTGRGITRLAEYANHHAAVVAPPDGTIRRKRIGAIAL